MKTKITWEMVYKDFRSRFPNFKKHVIHWHPHNFLMIKLYLDDGKKCIYNYEEHRVTFIKDQKGAKTMSWIFAVVTWIMYAISKRPECMYASAMFAMAGGLENIALQIKKYIEKE